MKTIFSIITLASLFVFADVDSTLDECKITCSVRCKQYAQDIKIKVERILSDCDSSSDDSEIVSACTKVGFSYQSGVQQCITSAQSAGGVRACAAAGFSYQSDIIECISNIGIKDSNIIKACSGVGFSYQSQIKTCISSAKSTAIVKACNSAGFSYQSQILDCIASK